MPHFQIGRWGTHLFIILAVIYENPDKKGIAERLLKQITTLKGLPDDFIVSGDHMKPEASSIHSLEDGGIEKLVNRLQDVKKAEFLVGRHLPREKAYAMTTDEFMAFAEETFDLLLPVYDVVIGRK